MNSNYLIISLALLCTGCKEGNTQDNGAVEESKTEQTTKNAEPANATLKQNGNYSSLFNSPDCKVITAEEISSVLGVTFTAIEPNNLCSFQSKVSDKKIWYLSIIRNDLGKSDIQREIETFQTDETGQLTLEISETGDTYLCIQHSHGYLSMYNPAYEGIVLIRYGSVGESRGFSTEERLEHRDMAILLANTLLEKYQK